MHAQISLVLMPGHIHGNIQVQFRCFVSKTSPNYTSLSRHHLFNVKLVVITLYGFHLVLATYLWPLVFMYCTFICLCSIYCPPLPLLNKYSNHRWHSLYLYLHTHVFSNKYNRAYACIVGQSQLLNILCELYFYIIIIYNYIIVGTTHTVVGLLV